MTILIWRQAERNWSSGSKCLKQHYYQMVMHAFAQSWHLFLFRSCDFNCIWLCVRQHVSPWGQEKWSHGSKVSLHQHHCCLSTPPLCLSPLLLYLFLTGFLSRLESNPALATATTLYYKDRPGVPLPPLLARLDFCFIPHRYVSMQRSVAGNFSSRGLAGFLSWALPSSLARKALTLKQIWISARLEEKQLCLGELSCFNGRKIARGLNSLSGIPLSSQSASFFFFDRTICCKSNSFSQLKLKILVGVSKE